MTNEDQLAETIPAPAPWFNHDDAPSGFFLDDPDLEDTELSAAYDASARTVWE